VAPRCRANRDPSNARLPTQSDTNRIREHGALNADLTVSKHRGRKLDRDAILIGMHIIPDNLLSDERM
jgi:hypothetical protein